MVIQIDSREKAKAIKKIEKTFDDQEIKHPISKLMVGDYMNYDNPRLIIDRKHDLNELCGNVCQGHIRFRKELIRARENEIRLVFLVEHGKKIKTLQDVFWWENPRRYERVQNPLTGKWEDFETKAITGENLYKKLDTMEKRYGCRFLFCEKKDTGQRIIDILSGKEKVEFRDDE